MLDPRTYQPPMPTDEERKHLRPRPKIVAARHEAGHAVAHVIVGFPLDGRLVKLHQVDGVWGGFAGPGYEGPGAMEIHGYYIAVVHFAGPVNDAPGEEERQGWSDFREGSARSTNRGLKTAA